MVMLTELAECANRTVEGRRLVNAKFPPISLFDDVVTAAEFEVLYEIQALTNPRLQNEAGNLQLIAVNEIPFGIDGCSYAIAPFTHINPAGSRFSAGEYGVLYLADNTHTALAEVTYHQQAYWSRVPNLNYDRFIFRELVCRFNTAAMLSATHLSAKAAIHAANDYTAAQDLGQSLKRNNIPGLHYRSARAPGATCWALFTPRPLSSITQAAHYEMVWNNGVASTNRITGPPSSSCRA